MARQQVADVQNKFIRGLITEATGLTFPKDACTEAWDSVFGKTGEVTRRLGLEKETSATTFSSAAVSGSAWNEYVWTSVGGNGSLSYLVLQHGSLIEFYDISSDVETVSTNKKAFSVDLSAFVPSGSSLLPQDYRCTFAQGDGRLLVVNQACDPILITYDTTLGAISSVAVTIQYRDFVGLEDGQDLTERVTASVATLKSDRPKHYYNLLNQGWHATDSLSQWDTARTDMPSNADTVAIFRSSATDAFDNTLVTSKGPGNTPAPKGHFILNAFFPDRTTAMTAEGFTGASISGSTQATTYVGSSNIGSFSNLGNAFDGNGGTVANSGGAISSGYIGKTLAAAKIIQRVEITSIVPGNSSATYSVTLYGKTGSAPGSATDGTILGSVSSSGTTSPTIVSNDITSTWDHVWIRIAYTSGSHTFTVTQITFYELNTAGAEVPLTYTRPTCAAFFAGRAWYAGVDGLSLNNSVFFSQIIQRQDQYGKCYQACDPTSEDFPDLLPDDGGVIKIPEAATIVHIGNYANGLLVFATNGVWAITGSARQYFSANAYGIRKISGVGTPSGASVVDLNGLPMWWGEAGIYTIKHDPNYDAYSVENVTLNTIFSFVEAIPSFNRTFVKGAYNSNEETITWLYNDGVLGSDDHYRYTKALQLNTATGAFYPFTLSTHASAPSIRGIVTCRTAGEAAAARTKLITSLTTTGTDAISFAEFSNEDYLDWVSYTTTGVDYLSYFITGYEVNGQAMQRGESNYFHVFMNDETDASCRVHALYDWSGSGDSGKWGSSQQCYNSTITHRDVRVSRLKLRGRGRAVQMKFRSETGKPFTVIGWASLKSSNATV